MTDPELATRTYIEPLTPEFVAKIIERERPQALLPTLGGQTALNIAVALAEDGTLDRFGVELIGAKLPAIKKAEDRELFKVAMERIGLACPRSGTARSVEEARRIVARIGYPVILRPSFTLGGSGGSIAYNPEELEDAVRWGLQTSPVGTVLVEESVIGWKEFELEVMRDLGDNVVIICSIENVDPMGIHTGDSITVAPAQTLSDKEYQLMRDAAVAIIREIGVETGGSNIQFAVNPDRRPPGGHRDEPPGVALVGPRLQGHRLSHRQDRRQAGRGLHPGRDQERHHPRDAGLLRAGARLLRGEVPALGLREVPRGGSDLDHADEVGGRGHGHRPHVQGGPPEVDPLARAGPLGAHPRPPRLRRTSCAACSASPRPTASSPWATPTARASPRRPSTS